MTHEYMLELLGYVKGWRWPMYDPGADADSRYARGEITRDEWMRIKASAPMPMSPSAPPVPPPRPRTGSGSLVFIIVVVVVAVAVLAAFLWFGLQSGASGWSPAYAQTKQLQVSDLAALNASATEGHSFAGNNSLWFGSDSITMVVYGSPASHDMSFVIQGMVNPTIHVAAGARVTLTMVNMDSGDYHTWSLTTQAPPYSSSGMMGSGGMMMSTMMGTSSLGPMSSTGMMWSQQMSFSARAGTYWYVCTVSDHAASGMYGEFVVA